MPKLPKAAGMKRTSSKPNDCDKVNTIFQSPDAYKCIHGLLGHVDVALCGQANTHTERVKTASECITLAAKEINCHIIFILTATSNHAITTCADCAHCKRVKLNKGALQENQALQDSELSSNTMY